jgi:uncharacterized protein
VASELLGGFRAVVINGPRQAGKSTLLAHLQRQRGHVVSLDDSPLLEVAREDPAAFLDHLERPVAIDEFQRGGDELLLALKVVLDRERTPGQFLLAGSTRFLTTRTLSETLTGRVGIVDLLPLSVGEIEGIDETFLEGMWEGDIPSPPSSPLKRSDYVACVLRGGFPELALGPTTPRFRTAWCRSYVRTVTAATNVADVADVRRPDRLVALLQQAAVRSGHEVVVADLARELQIDQATVHAYMDVLATLFMVRLLPAWGTSRTTRAKKRPVVHLTDTALAAHLLNASAEQLTDPSSPWFGPLLESFVVGELAKQASWSEHPVDLHHYRDRDQREVDVIIERGQDIVGIEVKATATPSSRHAAHLAFLRDRLGPRFKLGVVLHTGAHVLPLGERLVAAPVSSLWGR